MAGVSAAFMAIGAAKEAVEVAREFSKSMQSLATMLPSNNARLAELENVIEGISTASGKKMGEVAGAAFEVVSAFGDAADTAQKLQIVTQAAAAGGADASDSLRLLSAVTKAYGDTSAGALQQVADLAFTTNKLGQTTFPELAASIGKVAPLAAQLGVSQQELFGIFATLTGVTGNASEVSTQLASAMGALLKDSTGASKSIRELGFASAEALISDKGLVGAFRAITEHGGSSATAIQGLFKRKEAMLAVLPLVSAQARVADEKIAAMGNSSGAAAEASKAASSGAGELAKEMAKLEARSEAASVAIGKNLAGALNLASSGWVLLKEAISGKTWTDAADEFNKMSKRVWNDLAGSSRNAAETSVRHWGRASRHITAEWNAKAVPSIIRHVEKVDGAFSRLLGGLIGKGHKIGQAVGRAAIDALPNAAEVAEKHRRQLEARKRRAVQAARERARAVQAAEREEALIDSALVDLETEDAQAVIDAQDRKRHAKRAEHEMNALMARALKKQADQEKSDLDEKRAKYMQLGDTAVGVASDIAASVVQGEKASAGVRLASALLNSVMLLMRSWPHDPSGIALAVGGAVKAGVHASQLGSGGGGGGASIPSGPAPETSAALSSVGGGGGGGGTTIINVHGGLNTPAEVGAQVKKYLGANANTGKG